MSVGTRTAIQCYHLASYTECIAPPWDQCTFLGSAAHIHTNSRHPPIQVDQLVGSALASDRNRASSFGYLVRNRAHLLEVLSENAHSICACVSTAQGLSARRRVSATSAGSPDPIISRNTAMPDRPHPPRQWMSTRPPTMRVLMAVSATVFHSLVRFSLGTP